MRAKALWANLVARNLSDMELLARKCARKENKLTR